MNFKISRKILILFSIIVILVFYLINRFNIIINSDFAEAKVVDEKIWYNQDSTQFLKRIVYINFAYDNSSHIIESEENENYQVGDKLKVIIKKKNPKNASSFSFAGFWLNSLIYALIPIMFISALILTFINENTIFLISFGKNTKKHISKYTKNESGGLEKYKPKI